MASIFKTEIGWMGQFNRGSIRKSFRGKTKKEVEGKIKAFEEELDKFGSAIKKSKVTLCEWVENYMTTYIHGTIAESTYANYKSLQVNYINSSKLADMLLLDIRQLHIKEFFNKLTHLSLTVQTKIKSILNGAFKTAIENRLLNVNPCTGIKLQSEQEEKKVRPMSLEEQQRYIAALEGEKNRIALLLALFTGLRLGELIALKWENVDLDNKILTVNESLKRTKVYKKDGTVEKQNVTKGPKTKRSIRDVSMPTFLVEELKQIQPKDNKGYVFKGATGKHLNADSLRKCHLKICTRAKIGEPKDVVYNRKDRKNGTWTRIEYQDVNFHALRHTYATRLFEAGENVKTVSDLLGHKDISTTYNIYVDVLKETKQSAADKLDSLMTKMHQ